MSRERSRLIELEEKVSYGHQDNVHIPLKEDANSGLKLEEKVSDNHQDNVHIHLKEDANSGLECVPTNFSFRDVLNDYLSLHDWRQFGSFPWILKIFRFVSIIIWIAVSIVEIVVVSNSHVDTFSLKFFYGFKFLFWEIATIIYASGVVIFGSSWEMYIFFILSVITAVLANLNCEEEKIVTGLWILKTILLFGASILTYISFKRLDGYEVSRFTSSKVMLKQTFMFTVTMIFLMTPGLHAVYDSVDAHRSCNYSLTHCGVVNMDAPLFGEEDICAIHYAEYLAGKEELRFLRDLMLINIATYSLQNKPFLDVYMCDKVSYVCFTHWGLLLAFSGFSLSVMLAQIDPFNFPSNRIIFDWIEFTIFIVIIFHLVAHCFGCLKGEKQKMCHHPVIIPHH